MPTGPILTPASEANRLASAQAVARHLHILSRLAELGLDIAQDLQAQIHAATPPSLDPKAPPPHPFDLLERPENARASADLALAFARVSRAVRLSIALHDRLVKGEPAESRSPRLARPPIRETLPCEPLAEPSGADSERAGRERLFDRERLDVLPDLPVEDIIARLCAELGLSPDWLSPAAPEINAARPAKENGQALAATPRPELTPERFHSSLGEPYAPSG
jgi:hypothetical protein